MKIIAVDTNWSDLKSLVACIREVYPEDAVEGFIDPLLALKYGYNTPVDVIFAAADMKRLSGIELIRLLRQNQQTKMGVCLITQDTGGKAYDGNLFIEVLLVKPVTCEKLRTGLSNLGRVN